MGPETKEERIKQDQKSFFSTLPQNILSTKINGTNVTQAQNFRAKSLQA